ncbi:MAG TPA: molybdenum cofactor guanylyltransferase [Thermoleophilaceae bacterium]
MIGAVLAGGAGSRFRGASKPAALLAGRPLVSYPLEALADVCDRVAVVCKRGTDLPALDGVERWDEPDEPRHPLAGIVFALAQADGAPVLVCAADMPFVTADACRSLLATPPKGLAVVAAADGVLQPTFGLYAGRALDTLRGAPPNGRLTDAVEALDPVRVAFPMRLVQSVNTPEELAEAERLLAAA